MREFTDQVLIALQRLGWAPDEARRRLEQSGWPALFPAVRGELSPEAVADDLRRHTRCEICGHPLHPAVGDFALPIHGQQRMIHNLPHTAACSCGYARPLVPRVWLVATATHFKKQPAEQEVDAADIASM